MQRVSSIPVELPPVGNITPEQAALKSKTHWIYTPYKDISNMGPIELRSQLGYRDRRWTEFKRCVPYPLGNLVSSEPDRQFVAEAHASGFSLSPTVAPSVETVKYAQEQAAELGQIYSDEGLRVLVPLIGMDDFELVNQIVQVVQPFAYALYEMPQELTAGAAERIAKSNLSPADKVKAQQLAVIMANGAQAALGKANTEYDTLIKLMSNAQIGKEPGISNPNEFHEWICAMLNKPVPKRIDNTPSQGNNDAINILAQRALKEESAAEAMSAELAQEREARLELERKLDAIIAQNEAKAAQSNKQART